MCAQKEIQNDIIDENTEKVEYSRQHCNNHFKNKITISIRKTFELYKWKL